MHKKHKTAMEQITLAAIDIGSNAIRFLVNNIERCHGKDIYKKVAFLRVPIRLGEDVFGNGEIGESKAERLYHAMQGFASMMKAYQVNQYLAYATSAMRDARNGNEIVRSILQKSGIRIDIITGQQEADIILEAGAGKYTVDPGRNYLYMDVGGGSTEITLISGQKKIKSYSFQIGTVRMLAGKVTKEEREKYKKWLKEAYRDYAPLSIVASGGNINKIHKLIGSNKDQSVSYVELNVLYDTLKGMTYEERMTDYQLNPYRADVIIPAMKIFLTASKICKVSDLFVPKIGLVDGIIHHLYTRHPDVKK
ncbi:MAG: hypothetical protein LUG51_08355 [Tannerellaceae bacterium]|nr:hypothetical protein [Tannerellaceae bacterium]